MSGLELAFVPTISFLRIEINITDDEILEGDETFHVTVSTSEEGVRIEGNTTVVTVTDDDCKLAPPTNLYL